jgi:hypothetical protein
MELHLWFGRLHVWVDMRIVTFVLGLIVGILVGVLI